MRGPRIVVLWVLAIALAAIHHAEEQRPAGLEPSPEFETRRLVDVPEADAVAVRIVEGSFAMLLARREGRWAVVEPANADVPGDLAGAFVEALFAAVPLEAGVPITGDRGATGLAEGRRIEIDGVDGSRRVFVVGAETPTGTSAYVRDASGTVRIIGRNALVYRELLLDAARARREMEAPMGPVGSRH